MQAQLEGDTSLSSARGMRDVDVVILSWGRVMMTTAAVESILVQEDVRPHAWIVDQGSSEDTLSILRDLCGRLENLYLLELGKNLGVPAGRNRGMAIGTSEYIVSIDNDAEFKDRQALRRLVERFDRDTALGAIGFRIEDHLTGKYDRSSWAYPRAQFEQRNQEFTTTRFCGAGHGLRRSALAKTRLYDERLVFYWEEVDLSLQLISNGYHIIYDPSIIVIHKLSQERRARWHRDRFYYLVRNAVYLDYKYYRSPLRVITLLTAYLIKGVWNALPAQAIRGGVNAVRMIGRLHSRENPVLGSEAQAYIHQYETALRGGLWARFRQEVLDRLPNEPKRGSRRDPP